MNVMLTLILILAVWCLISTPLRRKGASPSTVSRNPQSKYAADKWEQVEPWPECFEEDDDL